MLFYNEIISVYSSGLFVKLIDFVMLVMAPNASLTEIISKIEIIYWLVEFIRLGDSIDSNTFED